MTRSSRRSRVGPALTATAPSISSFTRVSKLPVRQEVPAKKVISEEYVASSGSRKRKAVVEAQEVQEPQSTSSPQRLKKATRGATKRACVRDGQEEVTTRQRGKAVAPVPNLFQDVAKLKAQPEPRSATADSRKQPAKSTHTHTTGRISKLALRGKKEQKANTARIDELFQRAKEAAYAESAPALPAHLAELASLHTAFLKIITLQLAHNGPSAPIDLRRILCPNISRTWGKRTVTVEDIRTCIAIQGDASPFIVSDYGRGKICVEVNPRAGAAASPVNEHRLRAQFDENLRALCAERAADEMSDLDIPLANLSLADLPMAPITLQGTAITGSNPLLARGQRALAELKNGVAAKKQQEKEKKESALRPRAEVPDGTSLIDRIRMKQLAKANTPLPPSPEELRRRAALHRVADVAATISALSLANPVPRMAFSMPALLQRLRDSLRVPVSAEEGAAVVRLMAAEVTPQWIQIVTIGGRENVVIQRPFQPVDKVIKERVAKLCG